MVVGVFFGNSEFVKLYKNIINKNDLVIIPKGEDSINIESNIAYISSDYSEQATRNRIYNDISKSLTIDLNDDFYLVSQAINLKYMNTGIISILSRHSDRIKSAIIEVWDFSPNVIAMLKEATLLSSKIPIYLVYNIRGSNEQYREYFIPESYKLRKLLIEFIKKERDNLSKGTYTFGIKRIKLKDSIDKKLSLIEQEISELRMSGLHVGDIKNIIKQVKKYKDILNNSKYTIFLDSDVLNGKVDNIREEIFKVTPLFPGDYLEEENKVCYWSGDNVFAEIVPESMKPECKRMEFLSNELILVKVLSLNPVIEGVARPHDSYKGYYNKYLKIIKENSLEIHVSKPNQFISVLPNYIDWIHIPLFGVNKSLRYIIPKILNKIEAVNWLYKLVDGCKLYDQCSQTLISKIQKENINNYIRDLKTYLDSFDKWLNIVMASVILSDIMEAGSRTKDYKNVFLKSEEIDSKIREALGNINEVVVIELSLDSALTSEIDSNMIEDLLYIINEKIEKIINLIKKLYIIKVLYKNLKQS